jgi:hypothetical protein
MVIKTRARCPTETTGHLTHGKFEDFPPNEWRGVTKCEAIVFIQPALSLTCTFYPTTTVTVSVYVPANICCHTFQLLLMKTLFSNHISAISSSH